MKSNTILKKRLKAFTLQELLVVLVIVGILVLLALPNLMPLISKTKAVEAQQHLNHLYTLQKSYFMMHSKYTTDFNELGYEGEKLVDEGGTANYRIEVVEASSAGFKATATAVVDFDGDGSFNVWQIDQEKQMEEITKD